MDLTVDVYNIRYGHLAKNLQNCRPVNEYSLYIHEVETRVKAGMSLDDAVKAATRKCIDEGVMRDFLKRHEMEVFGMVKLIWNEEDALKSYYRQGREEASLDHIKSLMQKLQLTAKEAMDALNIPQNMQRQYITALS